MHSISQPTNHNPKHKLMSLLAICTITASTFGSWLLTTPTAEARITRNTCFRTGGSGDRGRKMGSRNASRLVQMAWSRLGKTCDQVDRLAQILSETPLSRPSTGGEFSACFYQGYTEAIWDEIDTIYNNCGIACFSAGAEIGHISAQGYCAASVAIDGLDDPGFIVQPPLPFCGENLVIGCKTEYVWVAENEFSGCYNYTKGYYAETFDNFVRQDCYVPEDVPIRDESYIFGTTSYNKTELTQSVDFTTDTVFN